MSLPPESREEAIARLARSASDLEARTTREVSQHGAAAAASSQAWRILAELFGGVFVGVAIGFVADRFLGTTPWGMIAGVLLGFAVSVWMARRTANRLMAQAKLEGEPQSVPFDDEDEGR
ncbi:AtpZ/AtpI family protein [Brevundimonas sp.]|jgi:ATP synthase protein I|uniref:AtpZ/AtpI family protein n=1 Tax=Brevundimonas sp. TaxID=1871086 RepID=UPI00261888F3|nr:AtpZ/AtpI family protein [Brevundimonas sp.]